MARKGRKKKVGLAGTGTALILAGAALIQQGEPSTGVLVVIVGMVLMLGAKLVD